jgi:AraC family transcriptional regulator, positive regulator of tynA and feaB
MMRQNDDILGPSQLNYEAWRDLLRSKCGRYYSEGIEPSTFTGWVHPVSARSFTAVDIGCNSYRVERTSRDVRLDGADHYFVVLLVRGQLAMTHNDQAVRLAAGDVVFVDAARPVTYLVDNRGAVCNILSLNLPRRSLVMSAKPDARSMTPDPITTKRCVGAK